MRFWEQFVRGVVAPAETRGYRRLEWSTKQKYTGASYDGLDQNAKKALDVEGDHLTIMRVMGPSPIYVRLGDESNPWIPISGRMVLARPFRKVAFADGGLNESGAVTGLPLSNVESRVLAYASFGPLVHQFPPKEYGLKRTPTMRSGLIAETTARDLVDIIDQRYSVLPVPDVFHTPGLDGATLVIMNTDGANDLYLTGFSTIPARQGSEGFGPIRPGQAITLQLDDLVFMFPTSNDGQGLGVKTLAGTCTFSVMLSRSDTHGAESLQRAESMIGLRG